MDDAWRIPAGTLIDLTDIASDRARLQGSDPGVCLLLAHLRRFSIIVLDQHGQVNATSGVLPNAVELLRCTITVESTPGWLEARIVRC